MTVDHAVVDRGLYIPRIASAREAGKSPETRPLSDWRDLDAYVLLGDPGSGKSDSLRAESAAIGGEFITARDFIALGVASNDSGKTLFIDGLDEMRAGATDGRVPLDAIRTKLKSLGSPRFRLSCREADWRAQTDLTALALVARGGSVKELHLEPLSRDEQLCFLRARLTVASGPEDFLSHADSRGLAVLFGNPLLLDLTVRAVTTRGGWPETRCEIYDLACRELATEYSTGHQEASPPKPGQVDRLLDDAGLLCAVLLLSGRYSLSQRPPTAVSSIALHTLPAALRLQDAQDALASKVFTTILGESTPRHRSIAEFLAGKAVARRLQKGLPLGRILALMQGHDSGIVEPLRGLLGWLAVHDPSDRQHLIRLDPLGVVLNGDVATYTSADKRVLLEALRDEAQRNPWFRKGHWISHPFAGLATPDMADALNQVLNDHSTEDSHQALVNCVLDALRHGEPMLSLVPALEAWVEDAGAYSDNRFDALHAWKRCSGFDVQKALDWLIRLRTKQLPDLDASLSSELLSELYPKHVSPHDVLAYLPGPDDVGSNTVLPRFWYSELIERSRPADFAALADAWLRLQPQPEFSHHGRQWARLRIAVVGRALEESGDLIDDERLHSWLGISIDKYGFSLLKGEAKENPVAQWLTLRPHRIKSVVAFGWRTTTPDPEPGRNQYWKSEQLLHGAPFPRDWLHWLLDQAAAAPNEDLARYCFTWAASAVVAPPPGLDVPTMFQIEEWVNAHSKQWPNAQAWLEPQWTSQLETNWRREERQRERKHKAESLAKHEARRQALDPHMGALISGAAPASLLDQIAGVYNERFYDINGNTPEERVQDFLVSDVETAHSVIAGLSHVLKRQDLPSTKTVLDLDAKGKYHLLTPVALLAARLEFERQPRIAETWPDALLGMLVACWLTDGTGDVPGWYKWAAESRPEIVAPLLVHHALARLKRKGARSITGLWELSREPGQASLARHVLPPLLDNFPKRANESATNELNGSLLSALHLLDREEASAIVERKLAQPSMNTAQRICWMVAALPYRAGAVQSLIELVGRSERRAVAVGVALFEQRILSRSLESAAASALSGLIEMLAPFTQSERLLDAHFVGPDHNRTDTVRGLVDLLASNPRPEARSELKRIVDLPRMARWREYLHYSALSQQGVAREALYEHPSPEATALTLANSVPANRADLMALVLDQMREIERHARGGDTFDVKLFWEKSADGRLVPRSENDCRDILLGRLRDRLLPLGVQVVPERRAADEKRADMRIDIIANGRPLAIPIEVKLENSQNLWLAWRDQLQALYTIDPAANGYGIYLVLWFGRRPRRSPEGHKAVGPEDLRHQLTDRLSESDRVRLAVCVLDLSLPA